MYPLESPCDEGPPRQINIELSITVKTLSSRLLAESIHGCFLRLLNMKACRYPACHHQWPEVSGRVYQITRSIRPAHLGPTPVECHPTIYWVITQDTAVNLLLEFVMYDEL